jgi:hypothetical protein
MAKRGPHDLRARAQDLINRNLDAGVGATPVDWVYNQSTGTLMQNPICYLDSSAVERANGAPQTPSPDTNGVGTVYPGNYAGHGPGVNNPDMDGVASTGPIPRGGYRIGPRGVHGGGRLPNSMRLAPDPSNNMKGRDSFLIHGGNMQTRNSSEGCIVTPPHVRDAIERSGDRRLWVVPGASIRKGL